MSRSTNNYALVMELNPKSVIAEAYRTLRTNIEFSNIDEDVKSIMVTSVQAGEGKSTIAANLAIAFAQTNKRVLLIDADLRKASMHNIFNLNNRIGLTSLLTGHSHISEALLECYVENLQILTSGPIPPNPSELLASRKLSAVMNELKLRYDVLIIDAPPAGAVSDALVLSSKCDGVLMVIDSGKVRREQALKVKASFEHVKARMLGVVLNNRNRKETNFTAYSYYGHTESDTQ
ncbi:MAG: capsular biosynthesis protein [Paenibacillaceae bacterium]|jgi:capsular exopolysaccharide synthesis family protein|nr:capsular biosynthesis protein [Paenibacillaceae bacterium]